MIRYRATQSGWQAYTVGPDDGATDVPLIPPALAAERKESILGRLSVVCSSIAGVFGLSLLTLLLLIPRSRDPGAVMFVPLALSVLFAAVGVVVGMLGILRHAEATAAIGAFLSIVVLGLWALLLMQRFALAVFPSVIAIYQATPGIP